MEESGLRGALNYAHCFSEAAGSVDRVNGWEAGLHDGLGYILVSCGLCQSKFKNAERGGERKNWL